MPASILILCVGNICRSPLAERLLRAARPDLQIASAGFAAQNGAPADPLALAMAAEIGVSLQGHSARQVTADLARHFALILVMEPGHRNEIQTRFPQLLGRCLLFDHWCGGRGIPDPYGLPAAQHRASRDLILAAAQSWLPRLRAGPSSGAQTATQTAAQTVPPFPSPRGPRHAAS